MLLTTACLADLRVAIPVRPPLRSLNVAIAAALVLGEALRQARAAGWVATDDG